MKNQLQKLQPKTQPTILVWLHPCNENQELNYSETFKGTPDEVVRHSLEIVKGLQNTLRYGTFSVKISGQNLTDCIYIDLDNIYDDDFEVIGSVNEYHLHLQ